MTQPEVTNTGVNRFRAPDPVELAPPGFRIAGRHDYCGSCFTPGTVYVPDFGDRALMPGEAPVARCNACIGRTGGTGRAGSCIYCGQTGSFLYWFTGLPWGRRVCERHIIGSYSAMGTPFLRMCRTCQGATVVGTDGHYCGQDGGYRQHIECRGCGMLDACSQDENGGLCSRCVVNATHCNWEAHDGVRRLEPRGFTVMVRDPYGDSVRICRDCLQNDDFEDCRHCGATNHYDWECECEGNQGNIDSCGCDDCFRQRIDDSPYGISGYSYTPHLEFRGGPDPAKGHGYRGTRHDPNLYLGFELEIGTKWSQSDGARVTVDGFTVDGSPVVYLKEDGSIPDSGFEIVTHPATYDWWIDSIDWSQTFAAMRSAGVYPDSSCGMHVHVSKAGFSGPAHEHRWLLFWHRNADELTTMSRRDPSRWARFLEKDNADRADLKQVARKKSINRNVSRYQAINIENDKTYEVRVFASTTNSVKVRAALGLVDASVEYCRGIRAKDVLKDGAWTWDAFRRWVADPKQYDRYRWLNMEIIRLFGVLSDDAANEFRAEGD